MSSSARPSASIVSPLVAGALLLVSLHVVDGLVGPAGPGLAASTAFAQGCAGCAGSYGAAMAAGEARKSCPEGSDAFCYQRYMAAQNKFTACFDQGCDTGLPTGDASQGSGSGSGSGGGPESDDDTGGGPVVDSDGDGVEDYRDKCPNTLPSVAAVDLRGCPGLKLTVSADPPPVDHEGDALTGHPPGTRVNVGGTIKGLDGEPVPGVALLIDLQGTGVTAISGTSYDSAHFRGLLDLPVDIEAGTYTVKVTASKAGYPDVSETTKLTVGGPQLEILLYKTRSTYEPINPNVPIEQQVEWNIRVKGGKYGLFQNDVDLRVVFTNLDTGASIHHTGLSHSWYGRDIGDTEWFLTRSWTEPEAGSWRIEITALKAGNVPGRFERVFMVGEHTVELQKFDTERRCHPFCNTHCRHDTVILDNPRFRTTPCYVKGICSRLHEVSYQWTAEAGSFDYPTSDRPDWRPPKTPGEYKLTVRATCTKDPSLSASETITVEAVTDEQWLRGAYDGNIEMRGFDRVKIEKVGSEDDDFCFVKDSRGEFTEHTAGQWLEGDDWGVATDPESPVTLGVYKKGRKVGEVKIDDFRVYHVQSLRQSTFGWLHDNPNTSPYLLFYYNNVPDRRYKAIDFSVSTPTCTTSRRGTKFFVAFDEVSNLSTVGVLEGEVDVSPLLFDAEPKTIAAHQWTTVDERAFGAVQGMSRRQIADLAQVFSSMESDPPADVVSEPSGTPLHAGPLLFSDDFSGGIESVTAHWDVDEYDVEIDNGRLLFDPNEFMMHLELSRSLPLENIAVEFDGWTEGDGLHILFSNDSDDSLNASLGAGEYSGTDLFSGSTPLASVRGKAFTAGAWTHFKLTQKDGVIEVSVDGSLVISARAPDWMKGEGHLAITANGRPVGVDNVRVYGLD